MKVSVVSPNRLRAPDPLLPVGAVTVAGYARELGHDVRLLDLCHETGTAAAVERHFGDWSPDVVAVSVRNLENNQIFGHRCFLDDVRGVVDCMREFTRAPVIAGGAGFSLFPMEGLRAIGADAGFAGEVEDSIGPLLDWAAQLRPEEPPDEDSLLRTSRPPGACLPGDQTAPAPRTALGWAGAGAPLPAYDLVDRERYLAEGASIPVEGKRGCSLQCSFCPEGRAEAGPRLKPPSVLSGEIERLVPLVGTSRLFFTDGIFHLPRSHAAEVCRELIEKKIKVRWSCGVNPAGLDRALLELMHEAGCRIVALGLDAIVPGMLASYRKGFAPADIESALEDIRAVGFRHTVHILFGGPGESEVSIDRALDELERLVPDDDVFLAFGLRVFRGTSLEEVAIEEGVAGSGGAVLRPEPTYYLSPAVGESTLERVRERCREHSGWYTVPF